MRIEKRFHIVILINIGGYHVRDVLCACTVCVCVCLSSARNNFPIRCMRISIKHVIGFFKRSIQNSSYRIASHCIALHRTMCASYITFGIFNFSWLFGLLCIERFKSIVVAIVVRCIYFWIDEDLMATRLPLIRALTKQKHSLDASFSYHMATDIMHAF